MPLPLPVLTVPFTTAQLFPPPDDFPLLPPPPTPLPQGKLGNWDRCPLLSAILDSNGQRSTTPSGGLAVLRTPAPINQVFPTHHKVARYPRIVPSPLAKLSSDSRPP